MLYFELWGRGQLGQFAMRCNNAVRLQSRVPRLDLPQVDCEMFYGENVEEGLDFGRIIVLLSSYASSLFCPPLL